MLVVRRKDFKIWKVLERTDNNIIVINPDTKEKQVIEYNEEVLSLNDFERLYK